MKRWGVSKQEPIVNFVSQLGLSAAYGHENNAYHTSIVYRMDN